MMSPARLEELHSPKYIPMKRETSEENDEDSTPELDNRESVLKALFPVYEILKSAKATKILREDYAKVWDNMFKWKEHSQEFTMDELTDNPEMGQRLLNQYLMNKIGRGKDCKFLEAVEIIYKSNEKLWYFTTARDFSLKDMFMINPHDEAVAQHILNFLLAV